MNIFLMTHSRGGIPQKLYEFESINLEYISSRLKQEGFNVEICSHCNFLSIAPEKIKGSLILYASSQYPEFFNFIEDCLLYAESCGGLLIPNFQLFRSHENKFYQELHKKKVGITLPSSRLIGSMEDLDECISDLSFPLVLKTSNGFGSKGVSKINTPDELRGSVMAQLHEIHPPAKNIIRRIKQQKEHQKKIAPYEGKYPLRVGRLILQEFLDGLKFDWKVLVFGNTCFCIKRYVRDNDFRASGSGKFSFDETPPDSLLNFAIDVVRRLGTPWASLDIAELQDTFALIEYQCVHFGLYTLMRNSKAYVHQDASWIAQPVENPNPEKYFCDALLDFIASKNIAEQL